MSKFSKEKDERIYNTYLKTGSIKETAEIEGCSQGGVRSAKKRGELRRAQDLGKNQNERHDAVINNAATPPVPTDPSVRDSGAQPAASHRGRVANFSDYVKSRSSGKSNIDAVRKLSLSYEEGKQFDDQYLQLKEDDEAYDFYTKNRQDFRSLVEIKKIIDNDELKPESLEELRGKGSLTGYLDVLSSLAEKKEFEEQALEEIRSTAHDLRGDVAILKTQKEGLTLIRRDFEAKIAELKKMLQTENNNAGQARLQVDTLLAKKDAIRHEMTEGARKVIDEFLQNHNPLIESSFVSLLMALSRCSSNDKIFQTVSLLSWPIDEAQARNLYLTYFRELGLAMYFLEDIWRRLQ
jgi:hypothetical protein